MKRSPRVGLGLASLVLGVGSCVIGDSPTSVGSGAGAGLDILAALIPSAADSTALPVNRVRITVARASDGLVVRQVSEDVSPADSAWTLDVSVSDPYASETVYVFVRLLNVAGDGTETVQFSGRDGPLTLVPGQTASPDVPIVRGPIANLFTTGVSIASAPTTMAIGDTATLAAAVTFSGATAPTTFWTSLDPSIVGISGDLATAVGGGTTDVVASAGMFADTVTITVYGPLSVTTTSLPNGTQNAAYGQTLAATGGDGVYVWRVTSGSLPTGTALDSLTGQIAGTPTVVQLATFTAQVSSGDGQTASRALSIAVDDDVPAGFSLTETSASTSVDESGTSDTILVVLDAQPVGDVVLNISSADAGEATVAPATLTFTNANWNVAQNLVVTGVDDAAVDGDQSTVVTFSVDDPASDGRFGPLADQTVTVTTVDDDVGTPGGVIHWAGTLNGNWSDATKWSTGTVPQAGDSVAIDAPGTYAVQLDQRAQLAYLAVGAASGTQTLVLAGGDTLTIDGPGVFGTTSVLELTDGVVNGTGTLTSAGFVQKSAGSGLSVIDITYAGNSSTSVNSGQLEIHDGFVHLGNFSMGAGTVLRIIDPDTVGIRGSVLGPGVFEASSGFSGSDRATIDGDMSVASLRVLQGTLYVDDNVSITDTLRLINADFDARLPVTTQIGYLFATGVSARCCLHLSLEITDSLNIAAGAYSQVVVPPAEAVIRLLPGSGGVITGGGLSTNLEVGSRLAWPVGTVGLGGAHKIQVQNGATMTLTNHRTLTQSSNLADSIIVSPGGTLTGAGNPWGLTTEVAFLNAGLVEMNGTILPDSTDFNHAVGAIIRGTGFLDFRQALAVTIDGDVLVGDSIGSLQVWGDYAPGPSSALELEIGGTGIGTGHDHFIVTDTLVMGGDLVVDTAGGFVPSAGQRFPVMTFGARTGAFNSVTLPAVSGLTFDTAWTSGMAPDTMYVTVSGGGVPAPLVTWTNASGGTWSTPGNWSTNQVPSSGDSVVIDLAGNYLVALDQAATVHSLTIGASSGTQQFDQTAVGTLTVTNNLTVGSSAVFGLATSTLTVGGGTIDGALNWDNATLAVAGGGTLTSTGQIVLLNASTFESGTLDNQGTFVWQGGGNFTFTTANDPTLLNNGLLSLVGAGIWQPSNAVSGGGLLQNNGSVIRSAGTGNTFQIDFVNDGLVDVGTGFLTLQPASGNPATHTGTWQGTAGTQLAFSGNGGHQVDSTVTGFDRVNVVGNVTFNGTVTASWMSVNQLPNTATINAPLVLADSLTVRGGVTLNAAAGATSVPYLRMHQSNALLTGAAALTITDSLVWEGGSIVGPGARTIASTAGVRIVNTGNGSPTIDGVALTNQGTIVWQSNNLFVQNGGSLVNAAAGTIIVTSLGSNLFTNTSGSMTNAGLLTKAGGTSTFGVGVPFTNTGTIDVQTGTLALTGAVTHADGALLLGSGIVDISTAPSGDLSGDVNPGALGAAGNLTITGTVLTLPPLGTYVADLGGTTPGTQHDLLTLVGTLDLQGSLVVDTIPTFTPAVGDSFPILTVSVGPHTGSFSAVAYPAVPGVQFDTVWTGTTPDTLYVVANTAGPAPVNSWTGGGDGVTWDDANNWSSSVPSAGDSVVIDPASPIDSIIVLTSDVSVQSVTLGGGTFGASLRTDLWDLTTSGAISVAGNAAIVVSPGTSLTTGTGMTVDGSIDVDGATIGGQLDLVDGDLTVLGASVLEALTVDVNSTVSVVGQSGSGAATLTVSNAFTNDGTITLTSQGIAASSEVFAPAIVSNGFITAESAAGGTRAIQADFDNRGQVDVSGTFVVLAPATIDNTGAIDLTGSADVQLTATGGQLTNDVGGTITVGNGTTLNLLFSSGGLATNDGTITVASGGFLQVQGSGGELDLASGTLTNNGTWSIFGGATVSSTSDFTNDGDFTIENSAVWDAPGTTLTNSASGSFTMGGSPPSTIDANFVNQGVADILPGTSAFVSGNVNVNTAISGASGTLVMTGSAATFQGTAPSLTVSGNVTLVGNASVALDVLVDGGELNIGGHTLTVLGDFDTFNTGYLRMTNAINVDSVVVSGSATFLGQSTTNFLTRGVLLVGGDFDASGNAFAASATHTTVLNGGLSQQIDMTAGATFGNLQVGANGSDVDLLSNVTVLGTFTSGGISVNGSGSTVLTVGVTGGGSVDSGINIDGTTFDATPVAFITDLADPATVIFQNATFTGFNGDETQFSFSHPGGTNYDFFGITFSPLTGGDTGFYISATDTAGDGSTYDIGIGTDPGNGPSFTEINSAGPSDTPAVNW